MLKLIAKGKRSFVYLCKYKCKKAVKKVEREDIQAVNRIKNEANWLKKLNKYKIGPKLYFFKDNYFICEYMRGDRIIDYLKKSKDPYKVIIKILNQCRILDKLKVDKKEMSNPYKHIIVRKNNPVLIDFERARNSEKPKNITGFFHFLCSKKIENILNNKGIFIKKDNLKLLLQKYKKTYSEIDFKNLIDVLGAMVLQLSEVNL